MAECSLMFDSQPYHAHSMACTQQGHWKLLHMRRPSDIETWIMFHSSNSSKISSLSALQHYTKTQSVRLTACCTNASLQLAAAIASTVAHMSAELHAAWGVQGVPSPVCGVQVAAVHSGHVPGVSPSPAIVCEAAALGLQVWSRVQSPQWAPPPLWQHTTTIVIWKSPRCSGRVSASKIKM
jgi:hypothetical protein